jgi:hypothetical protein
MPGFVYFGGQICPHLATKKGEGFFWGQTILECRHILRKKQELKYPCLDHRYIVQIEFPKKKLLCFLTYSQIWLSPLVNDH